MLYTVWSVNDGLSGNLWKPPETDRGGFWQVSELFINKNLRKPDGYCHGRFPDNQSIIDGPNNRLIQPIVLWKSGKFLYKILDANSVSSKYFPDLPA